MKPRVIFLDNGGVLTDNDRRGLEWRRLVGEFLTPRLGGTPQAWGDANVVVFGQQWQRFLEWRAERVASGEWGDFFQQPQERERWLLEMCDHVGVPAPRDAEALALATEEHVFPRVRAAFPDTKPAVEALHNRGYRLATASGETSYELEHYLTGMGIRGQIAGPLFGPDLVGALKGGPVYYERIFATCDVTPGDALVVDNEPHAIAWAAAAGARTVYIRRGDAPPAPAADHTTPDLLALIELLD